MLCVLTRISRLGAPSNERGEPFRTASGTPPAAPGRETDPSAGLAGGATFDAAAVQSSFGQPAAFGAPAAGRRGGFGAQPSAFGAQPSAFGASAPSSSFAQFRGQGARI